MKDCKEITNVIEFINELGSNKDIKLLEGEYNISELVLDQDNKVFYEDVFDGKELILSKLSNLSISGKNKNNVQVLSSPRYSNVLTFRESKNIQIDNLTVGHTDSSGDCTGGVLKFQNCDNIKLKDLILFGCGTYGLILENVTNFEVEGVTIKECTYGILDIVGSENIVFNGCYFHNNEQFDMIKISTSKSVDFNNCKFNDNYSSGNDFYYNSMFTINNSESPKINNSVFSNNKIKYLSTTEKDINVFQCEFDNNEFDSNKYSGKEYISLDHGDRTFRTININENSKVLYNDNCIKFIEKEIVINDILPSTPEISTDKTKLIYISPYIWEGLGDLHLYDIHSGDDIILLNAKEITEKVGISNKIKVAKWINNDNIICIIGQAYGTVKVGGDLYLYNIKENSLKLIYKNDLSNEEVSDVRVTNEYINMNVVRLDEELNYLDSFSKNIKIQDII